MTTRPEVLFEIRRVHAASGLRMALPMTRQAFAQGLIDPVDLSEVLLALRSGCWRRLEESGRLPLSRRVAAPAIAA